MFIVGIYSIFWLEASNLVIEQAEAYTDSMCEIRIEMIKKYSELHNSNTMDDVRDVAKAVHGGVLLFESKEKSFYPSVKKQGVVFLLGSVLYGAVTAFLLWYSGERLRRWGKETAISSPGSPP